MPLLPLPVPSSGLSSIRGADFVTARAMVVRTLWHAWLPMAFWLTALFLGTPQGICQDPFDSGVIPAVASGARQTDVRLPQPSPTASIIISAQTAYRWGEGVYEVWLLQGDCRIEQGEALAQP